MRRLARFALSAMLVVGFTFTVTTATASADHDYWKCTQDNTGYFCLFENIDYNRMWSGHSGAYYVGYYCGTYQMPTSFWDKASSWQNKQTGWTTVYVNSWLVYPNYEQLWVMGPYNTQNPWVGAADNDKADWVVNDCTP